MTGFGNNEVRSLGCFETIIKIDREQFPCTVHVVPNEATNSSLIVGSNVLAMAEVTIKADGITVRKTSPTEFLAQVNVVEKQTLNVGSTNSEIREEVEAIVNSYKTNKCKTTEVSMRIVIKDEKPIFHKPRSTTGTRTRDSRETGSRMD